MARIRTIKPEFWTSAQVLECSTNARLLFIGLWNFADDQGRHPDNAKQCKAEVFPADEFSLADIQGMLDELSENNLIARYVHDGKGYFYIPGWYHQRIDKPQKPKYPDPFHERSENVPRTLPPDTKGKDRKGKNILGCEQPDMLAKLKAVFPKRAGSHRWPAAEKAINARLREGHTETEILEGAERYARWCEASGKVGTEFVQQAATFVGRNKAFLESWEITNETRSRGMGRAVRVEDTLANLRRIAGDEKSGQGLDSSDGNVRGEVLEGVWQRAE
jgi:hypothetical protein